MRERHRFPLRSREDREDRVRGHWIAAVEPAHAGGALVDVPMAVSHHRDHARHARARGNDPGEDGISRPLELDAHDWSLFRQGLSRCPACRDYRIAKPW
jgi:hypothetical protein